MNTKKFQETPRLRPFASDFAHWIGILHIYRSKWWHKLPTLTLSRLLPLDSRILTLPVYDITNLVCVYGYDAVFSISTFQGISHTSSLRRNRIVLLDWSDFDPLPQWGHHPSDIARSRLWSAYVRDDEVWYCDINSQSARGGGSPYKVDCWWLSFSKVFVSKCEHCMNHWKLRAVHSWVACFASFCVIRLRPSGERKAISKRLICTPVAGDSSERRTYLLSPNESYLNCAIYAGYRHLWERIERRSGSAWAVLIIGRHWL